MSELKTKGLLIDLRTQVRKMGMKESHHLLSNTIIFLESKYLHVLEEVKNKGETTVTRTEVRLLEQLIDELDRVFRNYIKIEVTKRDYSPEGSKD